MTNRDADEDIKKTVELSLLTGEEGVQNDPISKETRSSLRASLSEIHGSKSAAEWLDKYITLRSEEREILGGELFMRKHLYSFFSKQKSLKFSAFVMSRSLADEEFSTIEVSIGIEIFPISSMPAFAE